MFPVKEAAGLAHAEKKGIGFELRRLGMSFDGRPVLSELNLSVRSGEFVAVVGRSGCGKSTLLRLVAGLQQPSQGEIAWEEAHASGTPEYTRVLFQEARLLPWKSVLDNVRLAAGTDRDTAADALRQVGLASRENDWPSVLSGGQRQRVALARALASRPRLLLLDEPLGALDALTRIEMQSLIESLWAESGFTTILVTHDVSEAVALADRVLLIEEGRIALDISIELARPRERDSGFAYYENLILNKVLGRKEEPLPPAAQRKLSYSI
ncbi:ATP-binding cassette domain-containing protein [Paenibacillus humicus]|uniref:ATP-binding cassette domain-containing protein n=1 Tax=Paenibacillus humicus TaxID=412861 RepID=UPI000FD91690